MDRFIALVHCDLSLEEKKNAVENAVDEVYVRDMDSEEYFKLVNLCLVTISSQNSTSSLKTLCNGLMAKLQKFRTCEFNDVSMLVVGELVSLKKITDPHAVLAAVKELITIDYLEDVVSTELSEAIMPLMKALDSKLSLNALVDIARLTQEHTKCLPPHQHQLKFCTKVINQISSLNIPPYQQFPNFMQDVTTVANMVQKIWMTSPSDVILPCLSNVYTLISSSSLENPPSCTLASFLNITPSSQIEIAVEKLLELSGVHNDSHVLKLASILCDWLCVWPKARRISLWLTSLFKLLTSGRRYHLVAETISSKAPKILSQSRIPVIRSSTGPVLLYILLTMRDQPRDKLDPILNPALDLFATVKAQKLPTETSFVTEFAEVLHILRDKDPGRIPQQLLADHLRPSEVLLLQRVTSVPSLADHDQMSDPLTLGNWLEARTSTGKIGLINLGNTCYVNSILQALCMNHDFTCAVLGAEPTDHQQVLCKLQQVFVFLLCSFRSAYSPAAFIKLSRPPWFEAGRQQDCSEFLRYLMDSLYEQERAGRSVQLCDQRWTVNSGKESTKQLDEESELYDLPAAESDAQKLSRWITEENLTAQLQNSSPEEVPTNGSVTDGLSNAHSESTDSGIQSVGDGHEEKRISKAEENVQRSLIHEVFGGKMMTTYRCLACGTESHHQDFFTDLHLAFPDPASTERASSASLNSLLDAYFTAEKLQGDNRYHCDHCAELVLEAERVLRVTEAPQHLLLTLLRFHYDKLLQRRNKITTQISYSESLELPVAGGKTVSYFLYAVVIHSGVTLDGGHYYTCAKSSNSDPNGPNCWFIFNDSVVSRTNFQSLVDLSRKYPTDTPYLLWYKRCREDCLVADGEAIPQAPPFLLPARLKQLVDQDNEKFVREKLHSTPRPPSRATWPKKDDDDEGRRDAGDSSFSDNVGSRFVF